ncbi:hypothetical protein QR680_015926 [Steinernema hermaphroditum]|uniref:Lecithin-cholesterol acyltransferase n=1 Tax=Steinernema hermaphroditum TaxID=289476 RepID=A0AA39LL23_9BILA|nr:hypothetical protein QR680_015926 [Steinernema hermaphroditum]
MEVYVVLLAALLFAVNFINLDFSNNVDVEPGSPVILVPGGGGNQLEAKLTGKPTVPHRFCFDKTNYFYSLWLNPISLLPISIYCMTDNMRLVFNETTGREEDAPGVNVSIPHIGPTETVEWLDKARLFQPVFATIVDNFVKWGYTKGKNVIGAPFDWRRPPHELHNYYASIKAKIEEVYVDNGNKKLYFYHYIVSQEWKDKYIKSHVSLNGAWGGSMEMVKLFISGYNLKKYRFFLSPFVLRPMQRTFTACAFMLPSAAVWNSSEVLVSTAWKNYSLSNLEELFTDTNYKSGWAQYKRSLYTKIVELEAPGVELHCIYGAGIPTPERFIWDEGYFPDYQPTEILGDGDGTVNLRSLEACKQWNPNNNLGKDVSVHRFENVDHLDLLSRSETLALLHDIVYKN